MKNIVETAMEAGSFKTLLAAAKAADLVHTLTSTGPYTIFAPTDDAFAKLPEGTVESLLKDKVQLVKILSYHLVPGKVLAKDVVNLKKAKTVEGHDITIDTSDGVKVDDANVVQTDIETSNGVIHVIDSVIMPN
ncbi:MAG: fasciclin domain-containing protein [Promethearchaeota archaeon]